MASDGSLPGAGSPPDPTRVQTPEDFGRELGSARSRAGLSVRQLSLRAKVPTATVYDYLSGKHLPQPAYSEPFQRLLVELGEGDPERVDLWLAALARARRMPGPRSPQTPRPYRGLDPFTEEDASWFFGREEITGRIVDRVAEIVRDGGGPLLVVGLSGAGKSSLLQAGVMAGLRSRGYQPVLMMLDTTPTAEFEAVTEAAAGPPRVLIADHFEDVFDRDVSERERLRFIDAVCDGPVSDDDDKGGDNGNATAPSAPRWAVILGMRSESYSQALRYPQLRAALETDQIIVHPMSADELRRAIREPARKAGLDVDDALVDLLIREAFPPPGGLASGVEYNAGVLPLLSHALEQTWKRQRGRRLTIGDYLASGGIAHSIAQTADAEYEALSAGKKEAARLLFLRLVRTEEDVADSRRKCALTEVLDQVDNAADMAEVVERFTDARLITTGHDTVEIAHEALLREWPKLREWLDIDRAWRWVHGKLAVHAREWRERGGDPDLLYRRSQLQGTRLWVEERGHLRDLNAAEREFYEASVRRQRDEEVRERRRIRRRYRYGALLAVLAVIAASVSLLARQQKLTNHREELQARSRIVAEESVRLRSHNVSLSMQLALAAYQIWPTQEATSALLDASGDIPETRIRPASGAAATSIAISGRLLAVGAADGASLDMLTADRRTTFIARLPGSNGAIKAVAFSPDARLIAGASDDGNAYLWTMSDPASPASAVKLPGSDSAVDDIAVSPDDSLVAAGFQDGTVRVWNTADPQHPVTTPVITGSKKPVDSVAFSPTGHVLAIGDEDGTVRLLRVDVPSKPEPLSAVTTPGSRVFSVAFSHDGKNLAAGVTKAHAAYVWNISDLLHPTPISTSLTGPGTWVNKVAFSPDDKTLAAASSDGLIWLFDLASGHVVQKVPHSDPVTDVRFLADGSMTSLTVDDGTIHWWQYPGPIITSAKDSVFSVTYSANGSRLGIAPGANDRTATVWQPSDIHHPVELGPALQGDPDPGEFDGSGTLTPDGKLFALGDYDGTTQLWDITDPAKHTKINTLKTNGALVEAVFVNSRGDLIATADDDGTVRLVRISDPYDPMLYPPIPVSPGKQLYQAVFSPDGHLLVAVSENHNAYLYDVSRPEHPVLLTTLGGFSAAAYSAAFTHDGHYLAVGSADGTIRLWRVTDPANPRLTGAPFGGPVGYIYSLSFAPHHDELAAAGNEDGGIWLWDLSKPDRPQHTATLAGPAGVFTTTFSPDGRTLVAGGLDHTVQLWNTSTTDTAAWICATAGVPITSSEWSLYLPSQPYRAICPAPIAVSSR